MSNRFYITAKNIKGKIIKRIFLEDDFRTVEYQLHQEGLILISVKKLKAKKSIWKRKLYLSRKVSNNELLYFTRNLYTLVNSGVNIVDSLIRININTENLYFKSVLKNIIEDIKSGKELDLAFSSYNEIFDKMYISMIKAGLEGGRLGSTLGKITDYLEKSVAITLIVNSALVYPKFVFVLLIFVFGVILKFVFPTFQTIYSSTGGGFPYLTQLMIDIADFFNNNFILITFISLISFFIFKRILKFTSVKIILDYLSLKIPVFSDVVKNIIFTRIFFTMSILQESGVYLTNSLNITKSVPKNHFYTNALKLILEKIKNGVSITNAFKESRYFPSSVTELIYSGEETGTTAIIYSKLAIFYETETSLKIERFSKIFEPIMIVVMGILIGIILISVYLPIIQMGSNFQSY